MHGSQPANDRSIFHNHMSCQRPDVGNDDVMTDLAIMGDVSVREKVTVAAHHRLGPLAGGCVHGGILTKCIAVADRARANPAAIFKILRLETDAGKGEKPVS